MLGHARLSSSSKIKSRSLEEEHNRQRNTIGATLVGAKRVNLLLGDAAAVPHVSPPAKEPQDAIQRVTEFGQQVGHGRHQRSRDLDQSAAAIECRSGLGEVALDLIVDWLCDAGKGRVQFGNELDTLHEGQENN